MGVALMKRLYLSIFFVCKVFVIFLNQCTTVTDVFFHRGVRKDRLVFYLDDTYTLSQIKRPSLGKSRHIVKINGVADIEQEKLDRINAISHGNYQFKCRKNHNSLVCSFLFDPQKYSLETMQLKNIHNDPTLTISIQDNPVQKKNTYIKEKHKVPLVVIDAGHGGYNIGASGLYGLKEKEVVLSVARRMRRHLIEKGYDVRMVRNKDVYLRLDDRTTYANRLHPDLFVSLHSNYAFNPEARGIETFYFHDEAEGCARSIHKALMHSRIDEKTFVDRGVKKELSQVLFGCECPSVLVELLFLSNSHDAKMLKSLKGREVLAQSLAQGVDNYFKRRL